MSFLRSEKGQILIPSILVLPCLFLFVFLIYETARLSREKIRRQFAVDAAAFVEMTNYADFLNRSAYVDGAFPQRIFKEGYGPGIDATTGKATPGTMIDPANSSASSINLYDMLWENGLFPRTDQGDDNALNLQATWDIRFGGCGTGKNKNPPDMSGCQDTYPGPKQAQLPIIRYAQHDFGNVVDYLVSFDVAQDLYQLYVQIYQLLGSVEEAQYSVFCRLTGRCSSGGQSHVFFQKSYWLNTGGSVYGLNDAAEGAAWLNMHPFTPQAYCVDSLVFYGRKWVGGFNPSQPYSSNYIDMAGQAPSTMRCANGKGLFHLMTVPDGDLKALGRGYDVVQHWKAPPNYFGVDFNSGMADRNCPGGNPEPCLRAKIALINQLSGSVGGSLWPDPTPKFQTRLYP